MIPALAQAVDEATPLLDHVALNSFELSALRIIDFDPEAAAAIGQGASINLVDGDDSGTIHHVLPVTAYPETVWRAVASTIPGLVDKAATIPLAQLFADRIVPAPDVDPRFYRLDPLDLAAGLRADNPGAFANSNAVAARIHTLEQLKGCCEPGFPVAHDALTERGWLAVIDAMPVPRGPLPWSKALLLRRRVVLGTDAIEEHAWSIIAELHAAIYVLHEAPFGAGLDFGTYLTQLITSIRDNPIASADLRAFEGPDLDLVREAVALGSGAAFLTSL
jgi:hypothetical protein